MRASGRQTVALVLGCILGFGLGAAPGDPQRGPGASGSIFTLAGIGLSLPGAQAASFKMRKILERRKQEEAERKAEEERQGKAREKRLLGTRVKELPPDCAYDSEGSLEAGGEVYQCGGMRYQAVKDKDFEGYVAHPVTTDRSAINEARERAAAAARKRAAEAKKKRAASRTAELPANCVYDAEASLGQPTDIYSCNGVLYRPYQEGKETGFERLPSAAAANSAQPAPAAPADGGSPY
jgi:hypothetical protein